MSEQNTPAPAAAIPADDPARNLTLARPGAPGARRFAIAGGVYTILVSGADTGGRYCLIDMQVPDGGGPPAHRHDFEELFSLLEGELLFTFRDSTEVVKAPASVNIPANAPHRFENKSGRPVHMLCMCAPAGQDEYFALVGVPVPEGAPPPRISDEEKAAKGKLARQLAAKYRTEFV